MLRFFFLSLSFLCLLPLTSPHPCIGVTYSAPTNSSNHSSQAVDRISTGLRQLKARSLRLEDADPSITRSLLYTNTTLFLTIPNYMVSQIARNRSVAQSWLYTHVVPFYPRVKITTISVGNAFPDVHPESLNDLLPAISNVHVSLRDLGIRNIKDTNSSFLINLYPYNLYRLNPEIPLGIALFQEYPFNFRDDFTTGVRYRNLFDVMVDAVVSALDVAGYETVPLVVTETGWPSFGGARNEFDANLGYAEIYLKGLVKHLKSGMGTQLLKDGVREVFVYEMFDKDEGTGRSWGVLYANGTAKYRVDFSCSSLSSRVRIAVIIVFLLFVIT
ncbi:hypothetical protein ACSQ67_017281 [Phaseolus vulgaris]